ncbi:helix-turn-helix transcriptional regulator [Saccharopolyspora sp. NPDC049426]|jgi:transcriptional regulator with XRE-family HTH domain|uniref:helix-turn-helix transcriptional regulator n=1 Tax=Saccharopolyspora sp. NPDC049426 TaxID=3155652 RepID=UPI00343E3F6C
MSGKRLRLARQRRAMGMTQEELAAAVGLGTDRSTIYRWESGEITPPARKQPRLARALGVSPTELIDLLTPESNRICLPAGGGLGVRSASRAELTRSPWRACGAGHLAGKRALAVGGDSRKSVAWTSSMTGYPRPPCWLIPARPSAKIGFLARNGGDGALQRDLFAAEATAATLMGQLVWDASQRRDHRTARQYFEQATAAAREIDSPTAEGHALLRTSYLALYGERDPIEGLRLTEQSAEVARSANLRYGSEQRSNTARGPVTRCEGRPLMDGAVADNTGR